MQPRQLKHRLEQGENAAAIHCALNAISLWTESLVEKAIDEGAAGIFLASQMSSYNKCTYEQYMEFGKTYDTHHRRRET